MKKWAVCFLFLFFAGISSLRADDGGVSIGSLLRGSHFRVRYIIPMRGNFAYYDRVEIVRLESALGDAVPREKMDKFEANLKRSFEKMGLFSSVDIVDSYQPPAAPSDDRAESAIEDKQSKTLVIRGKVIDYSRGNRLARLLGIGLAPAIFTVRFSMFDKETGRELARGNISGSVEEGLFAASALTPSDASFKEVHKAISDQVERRKKAALE